MIHQDKSDVTKQNYNYVMSENVDMNGCVNNISNGKLLITNYAYPSNINGDLYFWV